MQRKFSRKSVQRAGTAAGQRLFSAIMRATLLVLVMFGADASCKDPPPPPGAGMLILGIRTVLPTAPNPTLSGGQRETLQGLTGLGADIERIDVVHRTVAADPATETIITVDPTEHDVQILSDLQDTSTSTFAYLLVPAGFVTEVRLITRSLTISLRGETFAVKLPSGSQTGLKIDPIDGVPFEIKPDERTGARVVFKPFESLIRNHGQANPGGNGTGNGKGKGNGGAGGASAGSAPEGGFILKPEVVAEHVSIVDLSAILLDRVVVGFKPGVSKEEIDRTNAAIRATVLHGWAPKNYYTMHLPASVSLEDALAYYERSPNVAYTLPDTLVYPMGSVTPCNSGFENTPHSPMVVTRFPEAWFETTGRAKTIIAVIDSGFELDNLSIMPNWYVNCLEWQLSEAPQCMATGICGDWDGDEGDPGGEAAPFDMADIQAFSSAMFPKVPGCDIQPCQNLSGFSCSGPALSYVTPLDIIGPCACNGYIRNVKDPATGLANDIFGYNFGKGHWDVQNDDATENTHGTAVAGVLGAVGTTTNCLQSASVAGTNWDVRLLPIATGDAELTVNGAVVYYRSQIIAALHYANALGADVINVSLDFGMTKGALPSSLAGNSNCADHVIQKAGAKFDSFVSGAQEELAAALGSAVVVGTALNCPLNVDDPTHSTFDWWPNVHTLSQPVIAVGGATSVSDMTAAQAYVDGSAFGADHIEIAAPNEIRALDSSSSTGWSTKLGNSFAAPLVAGAAALMIAKDPSLSGQGTTIKNRILCNANKTLLAGYIDKVKDGNFLDAFAAVTNAAGCMP